MTGTTAYRAAKYRTIVADPPWRISTGRLLGSQRNFKMIRDQRSQPLPYPTMSVDEIAALPVRELAASDAHLYLWTVNRYLRDAYDIAAAWGFKPSTCLVWCKPLIGGGMGGTFGINTEYVLFCRRGTLASTDRVGGTWFTWPRVRPHSTKPDAFMDMVESVSPEPRVELFARRQRLGWDTWGNDALEHVEMGA